VSWRAMDRVLEASVEGGACRGRPGRSLRRPGAGDRYARSSGGRCAVVFWCRPVRHAYLRASLLALHGPSPAGAPLAGLQRLTSTVAATGGVLAASIALIWGGRVCSARQGTAPSGPCLGLRGVGLRRVMALSGHYVGIEVWVAALIRTGLLEDRALPANRGPRGPRFAYATCSRHVRRDVSP
jgi:hypothetical protein